MYPKVFTLSIDISHWPCSNSSNVPQIKSPLGLQTYSVSIGGTVSIADVTVCNTLLLFHQIMQWWYVNPSTLPCVCDSMLLIRSNVSNSVVTNIVTHSCTKDGTATTGAFIYTQDITVPVGYHSFRVNMTNQSTEKWRTKFTFIGYNDYSMTTSSEDLRICVQEIPSTPNILSPTVTILNCQ